MTEESHCDECDSGFVPDSDSSLCGPEITNCQGYTNITSTSSECALCDNLYFLNENNSPPTCEQGTKDNCKVYLRT